MEAIVKWMVAFERASLNCLFQTLVGSHSGCSNGDIKVRFPISSDLQLASFFVLGISPPPSQLWTNGCDALEEHI
jgi:hypothetical protein